MGLLYYFTSFYIPCPLLFSTCSCWALSNNHLLLNEYKRGIEKTTPFPWAHWCTLSLRTSSSEMTLLQQYSIQFFFKYRVWSVSRRIILSGFLCVSSNRFSKESSCFTDLILNKWVSKGIDSFKIQKWVSKEIGSFKIQVVNILSRLVLS